MFTEMSSVMPYEVAYLFYKWFLNFIISFYFFNYGKSQMGIIILITNFNKLSTRIIYIPTTPHPPNIILEYIPSVISFH